MSELQELRNLRKSAKEGQKSRRSTKTALVFLAPWTIGLFLITIGPMLASLILSFTNYNLLQAPSFVGFDNFTRMLSDSRLQHSLGVTFRYVFISVPIQLAFALLLAVILDKGTRGLSFYRSIFYLPSMLGSSVAIAVLWRQIFGSEGLVNAVVGVFGVAPQSWISNPATSLDTLIVLNVWTFGAPMVIFLAGLRQIPEHYYEAASLDGASRLRQFFSITFPLLTPIVFFNLVLQLINAFRSFTQAYVVSGGTGGPADSTMFYTLYLYQKGFKQFDMGYASALAWLLLIIIAAMTGINFFLSKYWVFYEN